MIYLDNGATTQVDPRVVQAMLPFFASRFGNPSSLHMAGQEARIAVEESRAVIAKKIGAKAGEIVFCSGGTEADNLAIKGVALAAGRGHIITSKIEHPAILRTCKALEKIGFDVTYVSVDKEGFVDVEAIHEAVRKDTILVSIMHANNVIGTIEPIRSIGKLCRDLGILFHTDCVQSFTKVPINVVKDCIDLASFSAHKIHGPKGVGALFVRRGVRLTRQLDGGSHEHGIRAGTENVPGIVGFAKAVQLCKEKHNRMMSKLRDKLIDGILQRVDGVLLNGPKKNRLCNNAHFCFLGIEGEALGAYLDARRICTSTSSACSSKSLKPSHVLLAIGRSAVEAHGSLRMTLSRFNTADEIDCVLNVLPRMVVKLRKLSPLKNVFKKGT